MNLMDMFRKQIFCGLHLKYKIIYKVSILNVQRYILNLIFIIINSEYEL